MTYFVWPYTDGKRFIKLLRILCTEIRSTAGHCQLSLSKIRFAQDQCVSTGLLTILVTQAAISKNQTILQCTAVGFIFLPQLPGVVCFVS